MCCGSNSLRPWGASVRRTLCDILSKMYPCEARLTVRGKRMFAMAEWYCQRAAHLVRRCDHDCRALLRQALAPSLVPSPFLKQQDRPRRHLVRHQLHLPLHRVQLALQPCDLSAPGQGVGPHRERRPLCWCQCDSTTRGQYHDRRHRLDGFGDPHSPRDKPAARSTSEASTISHSAHRCNVCHGALWIGMPAGWWLSIRATVISFVRLCVYILDTRGNIDLAWALVPISKWLCVLLHSLANGQQSIPQRRVQKMAHIYS